MKKIFCGILVMSFIIPVLAGAQSAQPTKPVQSIIKAAVNTEYNEAGKLKRILLGEHYRQEWAIETDIVVLDMDSIAGGLTALKIGGGLQTKSLRLKGNDGKEYVLRSVNKDPSRAIVAELRGTFAEDIVQDQISSSNPYAPMVVASLAQAAGIYHSTPMLVYVPKSERLVEFAAAFEGTICLLEERPSGNEENNPAYGFSKQVVNTQKLLEKIFANNHHQVDEKAFLKARLFDMLIGDWDRHEDQWLWAAFEKEGNTYYRPIPRDRDQAFSKMDGIIPQMATKKWGIRKIQHFDGQINDVNGLNANGMHLDRNFTTRLTLQDWLKVAEELQDSLTDGVIAAAFREMPDRVYNLSGKETVTFLKKRRAGLKKYATDYYHFLTREVNITATNRREIVEVTRQDDQQTQVIVYGLNKQGQKKEIIYERIFLSSETKEIRIYGLDGDDVFNVKGKTNKGIVVRVIGGKGDDHFTDESVVRQAGRQTRIYDDEENVFETGKESRKYISTDSLKNGYNRKSFRFDWLAPVQLPGYNADDGLLIGTGVIYKKQQFGKAPFGYMQTLAGNYAFSTGAYSIGYKGIFKEFAGKADLQLGVKYNSPTYTRNYYGLGNETINEETVDKNYYRVRLSQFSVSSSLHRQVGEKHTLSAGGEFESYRVENSEGRFVSTDYSKLDSSDFDREKFARLNLGYQFTTLDNTLYPRKGIKLQVNAAYVQNLDESERNFVQLSSEASFYNSRGRFTLASRVGIAANLGDEYEFYQANSIGGLNYLRGYRRDRFSGKTSVYQNTELRVSVSEFNAYLAKGVWGVLAFVDNGRVWMPREQSDTWHHGYGGGLWFLPFNKISMTATYGVSKEEKLVSISAGFLF